MESTRLCGKFNPNANTWLKFLNYTEDSDEEVDIVVKYDKEFRTLDELDSILTEEKWSYFYESFC